MKYCELGLSIDPNNKSFQAEKKKIEAKIALMEKKAQEVRIRR
jgi:hypothetical protein